MELHSLNRETQNQLLDQYLETGLVHLRNVSLPHNFMPTITEVVFFAVPADAGMNCEVYISGNVQYHGDSHDWQHICRLPEGPGGSRLVTIVHGDLLTGLRAFNALLDTADTQPETPPLEPEIGNNCTNAALLPGLRDLVAEAQRRPMHYQGRDDLLHALATNLLRATKPGVVLTGLPGVGKTALVHLLANRIAAETGDLPRSLRQARLYEVSLASLIQNNGQSGEAEQLAHVIEEGQDESVIYFIDEIHQLARQELRGLRELLKPALADGRIHMIGATTVREWAQFQDRAFKRRFTALAVNEPSPEETWHMVKPLVQDLADTGGVEVPDIVLREAIMTADRYLPHKTFPDKAIDLIDHAMALQRAHNDGDESIELTRERVREAAAAHSNLPPGLLDRTETQMLVNAVMAEINSKILGQEQVLEILRNILYNEISNRFIGWEQSVRTLKPAQRDRRPLACVLAVGVTGAGKTETAKLLANRFYNGRLITLNGSDIGPEAPHGVAMWVGSPPGYVGSDQGGVLTDGLRTHTSALILVDEIEKASPEAIQNCLLPLLGEGRVEDRNTGETLWATECIIFCTSNAINDIEKCRPIGMHPDRGLKPGAPDDAKLRQMLRQHFREEIIGRFNAILYYAPLSLDTRLRLLDVLVRGLEAQLGEGTQMHFTDAAKAQIAATLEQQQTGGRGVYQFYRDTILPLAVAANPGEQACVDFQANTFVLLESPVDTSIPNDEMLVHGRIRR